MKYFYVIYVIIIPQCFLLCFFLAHLEYAIKKNLKKNFTTQQSCEIFLDSYVCSLRISQLVLKLLFPFQNDVLISPFHVCQCKYYIITIFSYISVKISKVDFHNVFIETNQTKLHMTIIFSFILERIRRLYLQMNSAKIANGYLYSFWDLEYKSTYLY